MRIALLFALLFLVPVGDAPPLPEDRLPADFGVRIASAVKPAEFPDVLPAPGVLALGRALFFDPILSIDRTVSCASCHQPEHGFADPAVLSRGVNGQRTVRHTPSLLNRGFGRRFSWPGHVESLEEQVLLPIPNGLEMGLSLTEAVERLRADERYAARFAAAFGGEAGTKNLSLALAAFVSRVTTPESVVDRFQAGDFAALDDRERAGLWIYESKGRCWSCHAGANYTDEEFHATGVGARAGRLVRGRAEFTGDEADLGRFKTPTLRGLVATAPYMHDGSVSTLEAVVEHYRRGAGGIAGLDERIEPLDLTDEDAAALVAFLKALSRPASP